MTERRHISRCAHKTSQHSPDTERSSSHSGPPPRLPQSSRPRGPRSIARDATTSRSKRPSRPPGPLYVAAGDRFDEQERLAAASTRIPHGVVCLLSALRFHSLTTQNRPEIWLAIDRKARLPKTDDLPLRIVRFSRDAWTAGIQEHRLDRTVIRVYNAAKTVADCFKYRRKVGIDVAVEALRDC